MVKILNPRLFAVWGFSFLIFQKNYVIIYIEIKRERFSV
nr:MAG TPA: hypothetical protein [Caudoviricetes sp.]